MVIPAPRSISLVLVYLRLLQQLDDPDLFQPVQLLEGALTTRWLTCLLRLKRSSPRGALSQSRGDAELLLHTSDARLRDAELSIVAVLRINPQ